MKELLNNAINTAKTAIIWLGVLLIFSSFALNFWLVATNHMQNEMIKENADYVKYRDSLQLEQMDRNSDRLGIRK